MGRWKNTGWSRLKTRIKFISFFNSGHFFWETVYGLQHQFSNFCSWFSAFRRNDFGVKPVPSLQASGKLFWGAGNNFGCPKTQLAMFAWTWIFLPKNRNMVDKQFLANKTLPPPSFSLLGYPKLEPSGHLGSVTGWHTVSQTVSWPPW